MCPQNVFVWEREKDNRRVKREKKYKYNKIYNWCGRKKIKNVNEIFKIIKYLCIITLHHYARALTLILSKLFQWLKIVFYIEHVWFGHVITVNLGDFDQMSFDYIKICLDIIFNFMFNSPIHGDFKVARKSFQFNLNWFQKVQNIIMYMFSYNTLLLSTFFVTGYSWVVGRIHSFFFFSFCIFFFVYFSFICYENESILLDADYNI